MCSEKWGIELGQYGITHYLKTFWNLADYGLNLFWMAKKFPKNYLLWRIETVYGIPMSEFSFGKLPSIKILARDFYRFGHWLTIMHYKRKILP